MVAARNAGQTLTATLRSVQRQSESNWQCIVVDDHSSDHTHAIASQFAQSDPRFQVFKNPTAFQPQSLQSLVAARNFGVAQSTAPWIAIHDADDLMHQYRLRFQLEVAHAQNLDVVGCGVRYFPTSKVGPGMARYQQWLNQQLQPNLSLERFVEMPLAHPSMLIRRSMFEAVGGYQDHGWPEDYDLYLRLHAQGATIGTDPRRLLAWRIQSQSTSRQHPSYSLSAFAKCRAHYVAKDVLRHTNSYILWGYGGTGRELARNLNELGKHPAAILEMHPGRIGQRILDAPVYSPEDFFHQVEGQQSTEPILVSVSGETARSFIRKFFHTLSTSHSRNYQEGRDFLFTA
jgi:glycosyltransferase involved in cell wall biosynthesis